MSVQITPSSSRNDDLNSNTSSGLQGLVSKTTFNVEQKKKERSWMNY